MIFIRKKTPANASVGVPATGGFFLASLFALTLVVVAGCLTSSSASDKSYSVTVLGDLHYDAEPLERFHVRGGVRADEFRRNVNMWKSLSPALLAASARLVGPDTAFALQLGDLIQGQSASYAAHTQMLAEATGILETNYPGLPIVTVCGNHDILGRDNAEKAYKDYMIPWQARQMAFLTTNSVERTTFGFRHGPDLWVFVNFNYPKSSFATVEKLFEENPDVRYTFVATHGPVLPMDVWKRRWFYLGESAQDSLRRKMRKLLAERHAIVLAGHVHSMEYKDWYGDGGRITEMVVSSVTLFDSGKPRPVDPQVISETPDDYGAWLKTAPTNAANTAFAALYAEYTPGLKKRYAARAAGHHILRISDRGVKLEYYGGDSEKPTKVFPLR